MRIDRRFTQAGRDPYTGIAFVPRTSRIVNPNGSVVFEMTEIMVPESWFSHLPAAMQDMVSGDGESVIRLTISSIDPSDGIRILRSKLKGMVNQSLQYPNTANPLKFLRSGF